MHHMKFKFISFNVKGLRALKKRQKIIAFLKDKIHHNGFLFLQETHSTKHDENTWKQQFSSKTFFSHGENNSCGVLISYLGDKTLEIKKELRDTNGRILILDAIIDGSKFILINVYNANTENEQGKTLSNLITLLESIYNQDKASICGGDFNLFFDKTLECDKGNPKLKKDSVAKLIGFKETFDLCDIWRVRNPNSKDLLLDKNIFLVLSRED